MYLSYLNKDGVLKIVPHANENQTTGECTFSINEPFLVVDMMDDHCNHVPTDLKKTVYENYLKSELYITLYYKNLFLDGSQFRTSYAISMTKL